MAIGLALSGGGLRATLFHLGVVRAMRDANVLKDVAHICSVSGGSILAAHLVLHWEDYLGDGFDKRAKEILDFCAFDVRNHIFRRYPNLMARWFASKLVPFKMIRPKGATDLLQEYYGRLYGDANLEQLRATPGKTRPVLNILTTNLTTATLCSFGTDGFRSEAAAATGRSPRARVHITAATPTLSFAVGASSAFPGMFSPLRLTAAELGKYDAALEPAEQFITDGGVYDNLGIRKFLSDPEALGRLDRVFVSNASLELKTGGGREHVGMIRTALRASDILSHRVHQLESSSMERLSGDASAVKFIPIHIREVVTREEEPEALHENSQEWLRWLRTDLDRFSPFEIHCLVRHGWGAARKALRAVGIKELTTPAWSPVPAADLPQHPMKQMKLLAKSVSRRTRLFSLKDQVSWMHAALLLILLGLGAWGYKARADHLQELSQAKLKAEADKKKAEEETRLANLEADRRVKEEQAKGELLKRVVQEAASHQHRVAVELSYRKEQGTGRRGFKFSRDELENLSPQQREHEEVMAAHATLVTLYCLLKDDAHCLWHMYREHNDMLVSAMSRKNFDGDARKWRWQNLPGVFSAWPNLWCFGAINRLVTKVLILPGQIAPPATYAAEMEKIEHQLGENLVYMRNSMLDFLGDEPGVWLALSNSKDRTHSHPYVASAALMALFEYDTARDLLIKVMPEVKDTLPPPDSLIKDTCARLVADWKKNRWAVIDDKERTPKESKGLSMLTFACLLRVDERWPGLSVLTDEMKTEIGKLVLDAKSEPGENSAEFLEVEMREGLGESVPKIVLINMSYNWVTWAIDCASEWTKWQERNGKSSHEILMTTEVLVHLLSETLENSKLIRASHDVSTEGLAELHLVLGNLLAQ